MFSLSRRHLLSAWPLALLGWSRAKASPPSGTMPLVISSANGLRATAKAMEMLRAGADTLDAVIAGVNINEDDSEDNSVGLGGLPNERGEVELDASVMHGPTRRAGAVASLQHVRNPSKVAQVVMDRTDHLLLVGRGALEFALAHGFKNEDLLTDKSRLAWITWKETMSDKDAWGPGLAAPEQPATSRLAPFAATAPAQTPAAAAEGHFSPEVLAWAREVALHPPTGTINCLAINERGEISGVTTTSGLAWKIPGRVGDSPLIGCGLYVDNDVGAAGSTGRGEECIRVNGAHTVVETMRRGATPTEACLEGLRRVARNYNDNRGKLEKFDLNFYALNKRGEHGAAALWHRRRTSTGPRGPYSASQYAVNDGGASRLVESAYLLER